MGKLLILISAVLWSTAGLFVKSIPWSAFSLASFRGFLGMLMLMGVRIIRKKEGLKGAIPRFTKANMTVGLFMVGTSILYMSAIKLTSAANAIVLQYLAPVLVLLYTIFFEAKKPTRFDVLITCVIFGGCILAFAGQLSMDGILGNLLAIASGFMFAGQLISSRKNGADPLDGLIIGSGVPFVVFLPVLLSEPAANFDSTILWMAIALGLMQYGTANITYSFGITKVNSLSASLILTLEPVLNPVWVFLFYGEAPSVLSIAGLCCVVGALIVQAMHGAREKQTEEVK